MMNCPHYPGHQSIKGRNSAPQSSGTGDDWKQYLGIREQTRSQDREQARSRHPVLELDKETQNPMAENLIVHAQLDGGGSFGKASLKFYLSWDLKGQGGCGDGVEKRWRIRSRERWFAE